MLKKSTHAHTEREREGEGLLEAAARTSFVWQKQ